MLCWLTPMKRNVWYNSTIFSVLSMLIYNDFQNTGSAFSTTNLLFYNYYEVIKEKPTAHRGLVGPTLYRWRTCWISVCITNVMHCTIYDMMGHSMIGYDIMIWSHGMVWCDMIYDMIFTCENTLTEEWMHIYIERDRVWNHACAHNVLS